MQADFPPTFPAVSPPPPGARITPPLVTVPLASDPPAAHLHLCCMSTAAAMLSVYCNACVTNVGLL